MSKSQDWEAALDSWSAGDSEGDTPIFTALFLEYREAAFRRIGFKLQEQTETPTPTPTKEAE